MGILNLPAGASASAASQAKYESIAGWYGQIRLRVDDLRAIGNYTQSRLAKMSKNNMEVNLYQQDGSFTLIFFDSVQGGSNMSLGTLAALPANGNDVVIYFHCDSVLGKASAVGIPNGTVIASATDAPALSSATGAGTGAISLEEEAGDTTTWQIDCYAVFNAARVGDARFAEPLEANADVVGLYGMPENSGSTTEDATGGTALTLAGGATLSAGGTWNGGEPPVFTSLDIDNPNEEYIVGELLLPITVTKKDQFGADFTGSPPADVSVESLELLVDVEGTLTENFVGAVAIFDDLTPIGEGGGEPEPEPPVISLTRRIIFTSSALAAQVDMTNIGTAITARIADIFGTTDTGYVTPVQLVVKSGAGRVLGSSIVTPVAGIATWPLNTVAVQLDDNTAAARIQLGVASMFGVNERFDVARTGLAATTVINQLPVPSGRTARAVVQITGAVAGGNVQLQGTADDVNWGLIDATPFVSGAAASTFTAAFFGYANVTGLRKVRLVKSVNGVTYTTAVLTVTEE